MKYLRTIFRLTFFILITLWAALSGILYKLIGLEHRHVFRIYNGWKKGLLWALNIEVNEEGERPTEPGIIMANHRSYVDVALTPPTLPFIIVAKKSVRSWPLVGLGGDAMRTIWVDRESKNSRQETRIQLKERLKSGGAVLIFPEGTTSKGPGVLTLKPGMFYACAEGGFPIKPMAIEYEDPGIAWVGNDLFIPHFIENFGQKRICVKVKYGPIFKGDNGEELRQKTEDWLEQETMRMRENWDS